NGTSARLYINGTMVGSRTPGEAFDTTPGNFYLGNLGNLAQPADMNAQHVAVWSNIATSGAADTLAATVTTPVNIPRQNPDFYWELTDPTVIVEQPDRFLFENCTPSKDLVNFRG